MSNPPVITRPDPPATPPRLDDAAAVFLAVRPRLLAVAHRVLGDRSAAEDIVQDAWLRWQTCDRSTVENSTAFLVTTTTRLAINATQSARARRESSVDRWLPDPVGHADSDPTLGAERRETLELGLRVLLERLTPRERAAYVLRQAFSYPYPRIARLLHVTEANARQLVSRASRHIAVAPLMPVGEAEHARLTRGFALAARFGDMSQLETVLVSEVSRCSGTPRRTTLGGHGRRRAASHSTASAGRHRDPTSAVRSGDRKRTLAATGMGGQS